MTTPALPGSQNRLFSRCLRACGLSWRQAPWIVAGLLALGLALTAWLDGYFVSGFDGSFRRYTAFIVSITLMLWSVPVNQRLWDEAMKGLQPLLPAHDPSLTQPPFRRRHECLVVLVGFAASVPIAWLWLGNEPARAWTQWTTWYFLFTGFVSNILFGWWIYWGWLCGRHLGHLFQTVVKVDLFKADVLMPFARMTRFRVIAFVAVLALVLPLQTLETLRQPAGYVSFAVLLTCAVLSFFAQLRHIHAALFRSQQDKLALAQARLLAIRAELERRAGAPDAADKVALSAEYSAWSLYEQQVQAAPTWPFDHKMVKQVLGSALVPVGVYLLKLAGGFLRGQLLS